MNLIARNTIPSLRFPIVAGAALAAALLLSHIHTQAPVAHPSTVAETKPAAAKGARLHWYQFGRASWYGPGFQGQTTASGEAFDQNDLTCAHRNLPLGALVRVTNLNNHRSVLVRVNDRGPVPESRVVDLSYAAAQRLGFSVRGIAKVRLDLISRKPSRAELAELTYPRFTDHETAAAR